VKRAAKGPGAASIELVEAEQRLLAPGVQRLATLAGVAMARGHGAVLEDVDGRSYIDFMAGVAVASLGHSHPAWVRAITEQAAEWSVGSFTSRPRLELLELLASLLPPPLDRVQLYSAGAEAVEAALRLAKAKTGRFEIVSFWGGFHGKTGGVLPLIGDPFKRGWGPLGGNNHLVPYADCYRCPLKASYPSCGLGCVDLARQQIEAATLGSLAAIIVEPMQGTAGNVIPPDDWLPAVREIADDLDALLVVDEMITGFGRTGLMFGFEHSGTVPDILTIGKGFGGGFPVTGVIASAETTDAPPWSKPSSSSSSYGGNPLASAAALATVHTIVDDDLPAHAATLGGYMLERLEQLKERFAFVGDVRGRGLLLGMDLVADRDSKQPLSARVTQEIYRRCFARGLIVMAYGPRVRINPPLVLSRDQADQGLAVLEEVFVEVEGEIP